MESGMWFYDFWAQRKSDRSMKFRLALAMAAVVGFCGIFICGAGVSFCTCFSVVWAWC
jgi:phosphate/sulfate permease